MTSQFSNSVVNQIKILKDTIYSTESNLSEVKQTLSKTLAFVESTKEESTSKIGMRGLMECSYMKKSIRRTVAMNCHKYAWHWSIMSILMLIIGPLITIYAILLWIATVQTSLDIAIDMPSMNFDYSKRTDDPNRKLPPLVISHNPQISKNMETQAKMVSSKSITKRKMD